MTKSIESKNSRININFKQDIINGKHLTTGFRSFNKEHEKNNHIYFILYIIKILSLKLKYDAIYFMFCIIF